jgi:hypothetical protein
MFHSKYVAGMLLFTTCLVLTAEKKNAKPQEKPEADSCRIGSAHNCHCPRMVARFREKAVESCKAQSKTDADYVECLGKQATDCAIVANVDPDHREDACKSACRKDQCRCHDGPPCTHFQFDYGSWEQYP